MSSWRRKLRMGMIGGGQGAFIGGVHRIAAALDQQIELVAGCFSRDSENTRITGEQLHLSPTRCYAAYEEMAAAEAKLPEDQRIDFVSIVTPNVSHFPIARTFLDAGFHIICDKPMTYTLDEANSLRRLCREVGACLCGNLQLYGPPAYKTCTPPIPFGRNGHSPQGGCRIFSGFSHGSTRETRSETGCLAG